MKKIICSIFTLFLTISPLISNLNFINQKGDEKINAKEIIDNEWYKNIKIQKGDKIAVAHHNYYLNNSKNYSNNGWINNAEDNDYYIYLPKINNIDEAVKHIKMNDSARLEKQYGYKDDNIYWIKKGNTYTNTPYIIQDTTVSNYSTISKEKQNSISNSRIFQYLSIQERAFYNEYGFIKPKIYTNCWWNSNKWENVFADQELKEESIFQNQVANYEIWSNPQNQLGMDVSLSYINENSIVFSKTKYKYLYKLSINLIQPWINNKNELIFFKNTPHWGLNFKVFYDDITFNSDQIVTSLNKTQHYDLITKYLSKSNIKSFNDNKKYYKKVVN